MRLENAFFLTWRGRKSIIDLERLVRALRNNTNVTELDISHNKLRDAGERMYVGVAVDSGEILILWEVLLIC